MNKLLLPIIVVLITLSGCQKKVNIDEEIQNLEFGEILNYKGKPFSGVLYSKYKNGQLQFEKAYKDGFILDIGKINLL